MTRAEDLEIAGEFQSSMRGKYIVAKALNIAYKKLDEVEGVFKEVSDIADMRYLLENLYTQFPEALLEQERTQELMANGNYK